jgi:superfamily II DNA or RNA helicase
MLSLQQMERLARVIAALNEFRAEEASVAVGDPFAIGYYVGDANTPNSLSDDDMRRYELNKSLREEVRLLRKCPFCGSSVEIKALRQNWRLAHVCTNAACFSNNSTTLGQFKGSLPVCIVDNEIYRYLPGVLVGTVDKLAIIARSRYFAQLVRGTQQECKVHGYTSYDECVERFAGCKASRKDLAKLVPVRDPGLSLLIQDELHLLRAELGVFNGHYEGLLRYLGDRSYLRPKVLAATATIEAYDAQAFHIYLSRARRYPQPAWQQGESFYATSKPERHRRIYVGVLCHTRSIEEPGVRIVALYQREIRHLMSDPRKAAAIMERPDASDDALRDILRLYDLSLCYVNRKSTGGSIVDKLTQVEREFEAENLGTLKAQLLTGDQNIEEIGAALDRIETERIETGNPRLNVVVATNLISHGVDLERINMMTVCGMPSHYAEYVQSSSRAARSHAGIVFVCFKARDPRETSQFEFFHAMHQHMERLIEPVAVNRFASFAPRKTVPGLIAGILLCDLTPDLYGSKITKSLDHVPTLQIALGRAPAPKKGTEANCVKETYLRDAVLAIIGVDRVRPPASTAQVRNLRARVEEVFEEQMAAIGRSMESQLKVVLNPITSFRDVDEGIDFGSLDSAGFVTRLRAR